MGRRGWAGWGVTAQLRRLARRCRVGMFESAQSPSCTKVRGTKCRMEGRLLSTFHGCQCCRGL